MTRTARLKATYVIALLVGAVFAALIVWRFQDKELAIVATILVLLIPGRIQGHFYRDFFRGRRALAMGDIGASIQYTKRFLDDIRRRPQLKKLLWLQWSIYTTDAEAMALNNLGAAQLDSGETPAAVENFHAALALDSLYPLPFFNLAIERAIAGDQSAAEQFAEEARRLGFKGSTLDRVLLKAQSVLAIIEGRGAANASARDDGDESVPKRS